MQCTCTCGTQICKETALHRSISVIIHTIIGRHHWQAIPPIGVDVIVLWSVCLSVCLSRSCIVLKRQKISTRFLLHITAPCIPDGIKIWLRSVNPFLHTSCPKVTQSRHSMANCGQMVRDGAIVTIEIAYGKLPSLFRMVTLLLTPYDFPCLKRGSQIHPITNFATRAATWRIW